mgnify:FL=1
MKQIEEVINGTTNPDELFEIGRKYMASGNYDIAFEAFTKAKSLGHVKSITGLGILIASGRYSKQYPPSVGIAYLEEAVSKGDTQAKELLAFYKQEVHQ